MGAPDRLIGAGSHAQRLTCSARGEDSSRKGMIAMGALRRLSAREQRKQAEREKANRHDDLPRRKARLSRQLITFRARNLSHPILQ